MTSPIISRSHAQINITPNGHIYLTDLASLHGTQIIPSGSILSCISSFNEPNPQPIRLKPYSPVQICDGDTVFLGKSVQSGREDYRPIKVRVSFHYPELGRGSGSGAKRTSIGPWTDSANGKFAFIADLGRLSAIVRKTGTWQAEQEKMMGSSDRVEESNVREEPGGETQSRWQHLRRLDMTTHPSSESDPSRSEDERKLADGVYDPLTPLSSPGDVEVAPDQQSTKSGVYRVPPSVLYQSEDEQDLPRGSTAVRGDRSEDLLTEDEGPEVFSVHRKPSVRPASYTERTAAWSANERLSEAVLPEVHASPYGIQNSHRFGSCPSNGVLPQMWGNSPCVVNHPPSYSEHLPFDRYSPARHVSDSSKVVQMIGVEWLSQRVPLESTITTPYPAKAHAALPGDEEEIPAEDDEGDDAREGHSQGSSERDPAYGRWYSYSSEVEEEAVGSRLVSPISCGHGAAPDEDLSEEEEVKSEKAGDEQQLPATNFQSLFSEHDGEDAEVKDEVMEEVPTYGDDRARSPSNSERQVT